MLFFDMIFLQFVLLRIRDLNEYRICETNKNVIRTDLQPCKNQNES
jgi:hypothetical protein